MDSVIQVKVAANEAVAAAQRAMYHQPCSLAQVQAREADIRALADLTRALDKKVCYYECIIVYCNMTVTFKDIINFRLPDV